MTFYAWTGQVTGLTTISTQEPPEGVIFATIEGEAPDPSSVYVADDGTLATTPACDNPCAIFDPVSMSWVDYRSEAQIWAALRAERDALLAACDWTQATDAPLTAEQVTAWRAYRHALRDLPENTTNPRNPSWPLPPAK